MCRARLYAKRFVFSSQRAHRSKPRTGTRVAPMSGWALWDPDVLECLAETDHAARFDPHIADMRAAIEPVGGTLPRAERKQAS